MKKKKFYNMTSATTAGSYGDRSDRMRLEAKDGAMISEDHSAIANMPQNVIMKTYSQPYGYLREVYEDTIEGIDAQIRGDDAKRDQHLKPRKI